MAKTLSIINMKGGVGKTTLTLHLAYDLAHRHKKRVLVIDCDPQANATEGLLDPEKYRVHRRDKKTVSDLFSDTSLIQGPVAAAAQIKAPEFDQFVCRARQFPDGHIDLAPADIYLSNILERARGSMLEHRLLQLIEPRKPAYDYILIDCSPTYSVLTNNSLHASDAVLIPVKPDAYASKGIPILLKKISDHNSDVPADKQVRILGIVFTVVDDSLPIVVSTKAEILREHRDVFQNSIEFSRSYPRAITTSQTIFEIKRVNQGTKVAMQNVTDELIRRMEAAP